MARKEDRKEDWKDEDRKEDRKEERRPKSEGRRMPAESSDRPKPMAAYDRKFDVKR